TTGSDTSGSEDREEDRDKDDDDAREGGREGTRDSGGESPRGCGEGPGGCGEGPGEGGGRRAPGRQAHRRAQTGGAGAGRGRRERAVHVAALPSKDEGRRGRLGEDGQDDHR